MGPNPAQAPRGGQPSGLNLALHSTDSPDSPAIDSETAVLLRGWLRPLIDRSASWPALAAALDAHGYALAFRDGRLCLTNRTTGACICTMRFLGTGLKDLVARLGRPAVRPVPGRPASGELCCTPPRTS